MPWWRRKLSVAMASLLVGFVVGMASAGSADTNAASSGEDVESAALAGDLQDARLDVSRIQGELADSSSELDATTEELERTRADLEAAEAAAETAQQEAKDAEEELSTRTASLDDRDESLDARKQNLDDRKDELDDRAADLDAREAAVAEAESQVTVAPQRAHDDPPEDTSSDGACHPAYDPCVPPAPPDLDCADVNGPISVNHAHGDPHGFDRDRDGVGCEG